MASVLELWSSTVESFARVLRAVEDFTWDHPVLAWLWLAAWIFVISAVA